MAGKEGLLRLTGPGDGCVAGPGGSDPCTQGDCPNVYVTQHGTILVQGDLYTGFSPPPGESVVEIPEETLREAFRALGWT
jgi:hypothetical protein